MMDLVVVKDFNLTPIPVKVARCPWGPPMGPRVGGECFVPLSTLLLPGKLVEKVATHNKDIHMINHT